MPTPLCADGKLRPTYEDIHKLIDRSAAYIKADFDPDLMVLISGGGLIPGRIMRSFLKRPSELDPTRLRNIPTQAIGLSLYEEVAGMVEGSIGKSVTRTQWISEKALLGHKDPSKKVEEGKDAGGLVGKKILIVDEVDDSRTTLQYAYQELYNDVRQALSSMSEQERAAVPATKFACFVVHNKRNIKKGKLPILNENNHIAGDGAAPANNNQPVERIENGIVEGIRYYAGEDTENEWIAYPWESEDITEHNRLAADARKKAGQK
ncbi:hypothetical protein K437DRAFT_256483 [Tilletiaria anomala UBC 951]|uniref:PRTase-like protein n=1 Tax=Tilletiaria anomala (strain ATCC 24038 / CBS 436.72 / UBC 951) TaxID=1037660 RepID=A0A066VZP3_TILAU|nr:uncharacterized protein K437DRAFT_256483 [Tilletiaria anomala UBC 951]KDN45758.1 hypothetical protein K437DRAFT_256483 [Tilletiaria anomala UBC 951]